MEPANRIVAAITLAAIIVGLAGLDARSCVTASPMAGRAGSGQGRRKPDAGPSLLLTVIDRRDRSPLADAPVWVRATGRHVHTWEGMTDDQGRYKIVPPDESTQGFTITVAPVGHALGGLESAVGAPDYTLELERAEAVGGVVQDDEGRPIEGARVFATTYPFTKLWPEIYASPNGAHAIATTDAQGRWRLDALPVGSERAGKAVRVLVRHPDRLAAESTITTEQARAQSSVQTIKTGVALSGTVLSPFGRPVRDAAVTIALPPWGGTDIRLTTDREGRFRTGRCLDPRWPKVVMSVQATGLAWDFRDVAVSPKMPPEIIRLTRRRPIEGRVVDAPGHPVTGAVVSGSRRFFKDLIDWEAETDVMGRFVWSDAPTSGVLLLDITRPGYQPVNKSVVRPGTSEVAITIQPD